MYSWPALFYDKRRPSLSVFWITLFPGPVALSQTRHGHVNPVRSHSPSPIPRLHWAWALRCSSSFQKKGTKSSLTSAWNHYLSCSLNHPPNHFSWASLRGCLLICGHLFHNSVSHSWVTHLLHQYIMGDSSITVSPHCIDYHTALPHLSLRLITTGNVFIASQIALKI